MDEYNGIGKSGQIPWRDTPHGKKDIAHFKNITKENMVLMGYSTYLSIKKLLPDRVNVIVTKSHSVELMESLKDNKSEWYVFTSVDDAIKFARQWEIINSAKCYVIGGGQIYNYFLNRYNFKKAYITIIPGNYHCDTFYPGYNYKCTNDEPMYLTIDGKSADEEYKYLCLFNHVLSHGHEKTDRTGTGTISYFSPQNLEFSLENGTLPVLTTKSVPIKSGVIPELLWFISGSTDTRILEKQGCNIWKGNTRKEFLTNRGLPYKEGDMGPGYGFQWRHCGAKYKGMECDYEGQGIDQLQSIIKTLREDPDSRRMLMVSWQVPWLDEMALPPCHVLYQVYTHQDKDGVRYLSAKMYQRSADSFLGVPFNITSYALLTHILAQLTGMRAHRLIMTFGDYHIYKNHITQVNEQMSREPGVFPKILFNRYLNGTNITDVTSSDFEIVGYVPHGKITAPMAV